MWLSKISICDHLIHVCHLLPVGGEPVCLRFALGFFDCDTRVQLVSLARLYSVHCTEHRDSKQDHVFYCRWNWLPPPQR